MKKLIVSVLISVCVLGLVSCGQQESSQQGDNVQYFFTAKVIGVNEDCLLLEVFDTGNCNLFDGAMVEVSTNVVSADGCPEFVVDEYARVVMARNTKDNSTKRLEALSIYKTDKTGLLISD